MKPDKLIWFAIVFSTLIYAAIIYTLHPNPQGSFEDAVKDPKTLVLYGLAIVTFFGAMLVPGFLRGQARQKLIVSLALFEACAIYGLLAAFLAQDWRVFVPAWAIALLGFWKMYPSNDATAVNV